MDVSLQTPVQTAPKSPIELGSDGDSGDEYEPESPPEQLLELAFAGCLAPARMGPTKFPKRPFTCTKIWIKGETLRKCLNVASTVQLLGKMVDL